MIECTKMNGEILIINAEMIEFIQATPDTIITTLTGKKILVKESVQHVIDDVINYRRMCFPYKKFFPKDLEVMEKEEFDEYNQTSVKEKK